MSERFAGKRCIVTGAASGIGAAASRRFVEEGAQVVAVDALPIAPSRNLAAIQCDVADEAAAAAAIAEHGPADILVTAAGISVGGAVHATSLETWQSVLSVNLMGTVVWAAAVLPAMRANGHGAIVTLASQLALAGGRGNASYVASKGAVVALTRSMALDYAQEGVRVNCVVPGAIKTAMLDRSFARAPDAQAARARSRARHAMGRFGTAEEVVRAIVWVASEEASFTTGALIPVDGGWLAA